MARELKISQPTVADRIRRLGSRGILCGAMLRVDHARLGFNVSAFVRLRVKASHKRTLTQTARAMPQVIKMHSVTGNDCMIARVIARSVEELAEILQRLTLMAESSTSVVLETRIPLRNPIPSQEPLAGGKRAAKKARGRRLILADAPAGGIVGKQGSA